jgi:hypothetical protein
MQRQVANSSFRNNHVVLLLVAMLRGCCVDMLFVSAWAAATTKRLMRRTRAKNEVWLTLARKKFRVLRHNPPPKR